MADYYNYNSSAARSNFAPNKIYNDNSKSNTEQQRADIALAVNEALENLASNFQQLLQLFSHAVNGATSPTSSREACCDIQAKWHLVQQEIGHIQDIVGPFESETVPFIEELDRIVAELSYGQGDPKEHRSQFPFFALKVLSSIKIAVKNFHEQLAHAVNIVSNNQKLNGQTKNYSSNENLPAGTVPLESRSKLNTNPNLSLSTSNLKVQIDKNQVVRDASDSQFLPNNDQVVTSPDKNRDVRQLELRRMQEEKKGTVKEKVERLESALSPMSSMQSLGRSFANLNKTNITTGASGSNKSQTQLNASNGTYHNNDVHSEYASDIQQSQKLNQYETAREHETYTTDERFHNVQREENNEHNGSSLVYGQSAAAEAQSPYNLSDGNRQRSNILVEQERHLFEMHKQQQQYLMQQQQIARLQAAQAPSSDEALYERKPAYNLSLDRESSKAAKYDPMQASDNFRNMPALAEQNQYSENERWNQSETNFGGRAQDIDQQQPARANQNYRFSNENLPQSNSNLTQNKPNLNGYDYTTNGMLPAPDNDLSTNNLDNVQIEQWLQSSAPPQVHYDYSPAQVGPEADSHAGSGLTNIPQIGNTLVEAVQVILIPLNGMFDTGYLNLTIPNRLGRHNGTNYPRFLAFPSQVVSRSHLEIWSDKARVFIRDIGSMSGTFLNGERLSEPGKQSAPVEIKSGDRIRLGKDFVEERNLGDPNFVPEVRYRSVKMKILILPTSQQHNMQVVSGDASRANNDSTRIPATSGNGASLGSSASNLATSTSMLASTANKQSIRVAGVKMTYIAMLCEYQGKIKEIQLTPAKQNNKEMCNTYSATIKNWESKKRLTVEEFIPAIGRVQEVEVLRDPINQQLYNVNLEDGTFAGSIQVVSDIKVTLNLPISGSIAPSITITGDFKDCKYYVVLKTTQSREQRCIGESIAKTPYKVSAGNNNSGGTLRIGLGAHNVTRYMYQFEFEDGEWSRLLLLANIFMAVAFHK